MDQYKFYDPTPKKYVLFGFSFAIDVQICEAEKGFTVTGENCNFI